MTDDTWERNELHEQLSAEREGLLAANRDLGRQLYALREENERLREMARGLLRAHDRAQGAEGYGDGYGCIGREEELRIHSALQEARFEFGDVHAPPAGQEDGDA